MYVIAEPDKWFVIIFDEDDMVSVIQVCVCRCIVPVGSYTVYTRDDETILYGYVFTIHSQTEEYLTVS